MEAAFALPKKAQFWNAVPSSLPVENGSYEVAVPELHWTITGNHSTGTIQIHKPGEPAARHTALEDYGLLRRAASAILEGAYRPDNHEAKYMLDTYDSAMPFCDCAM